jgi:hypothetical protein
MKPERNVSLAYTLPEWCRTPVFPAVVGKELRALMPLWLLALVVLTLTAWPLRHYLMTRAELNLALNGVFCLIFGASTFGYEFNHRTMPLLLAQPRARASLWRVKMGVLVFLVMTTSLVTGGFGLQFYSGFLDDSFDTNQCLILAATVLSAVGVAPWMTLLTRSTLAGAVFAGALPIGLWGTANLLGWAVFGDKVYADNPPDTFIWTCYLVPLIGHWVAAPFLGYRAFVRLQALDGPNAGLRLPRWLARWLPAKAAVADVPRRRNVVWELVKKELHLQQMTFLLAGLFCLGWLAAVVLEMIRLKYGNPEAAGTDPLGWVFMYLFVVPLLAGALSCAEERQHGTLAWQLIQPLAAWRQWLVKVGVVVGLALVLAVGLPLALLLVSPFPEARREFTGDAIGSSPYVVGACCVAIYLSSLSQTSVRALLSSLVAVVLTGAAVVAVVNGFARFYRPVVNWDALHQQPFIFMAEILAATGATLLLALLLGFALANFRRLDRGARRVLSQVGVLALAIGVWCAAYVSLAVVAGNAFQSASVQATQLVPPPKPPPWRLDRVLLQHNGFLSLNTDKILRAVDALRRAATTAGQALPQTMALSNLVAQGYLKSADVQDYDGMEATVLLTADRALPEAVLLRVTSPRGIQMVVRVTGRVELLAHYETEQAAVALNLFLLNYPKEPLVRGDRLNPLVIAAAPDVNWDDVKVSLADTAALAQAVREQPQTIVACSQTAVEYSSHAWQRFYALADGSVRWRMETTPDSPLSGVFSEPPRPMMDLRMMICYGLVKLPAGMTLQTGGDTNPPTPRPNANAVWPLSWEPPGASENPVFTLGGRQTAAGATNSPTTLVTDTNPPVIVAAAMAHAALDQMRQASLALRVFALGERPEPLSLGDGRLNPALTNLAPAVNWDDVEVLVPDKAELQHWLRAAPDTIIARSRAVMPSADGRWQRFYALANGSVCGVMQDRPGEALAGAWSRPVPPKAMMSKEMMIRFGLVPGEKGVRSEPPSEPVPAR